MVRCAGACATCRPFVVFCFCPGGRPTKKLPPRVRGAGQAECEASAKPMTGRVSKENLRPRGKSFVFSPWALSLLRESQRTPAIGAVSHPFLFWGGVPLLR